MKLTDRILHEGLYWNDRAQHWSLSYLPFEDADLLRLKLSGGKATAVKSRKVGDTEYNLYYAYELTAKGKALTGEQRTEMYSWIKTGLKEEHPNDYHNLIVKGLSGLDRSLKGMLGIQEFTAVIPAPSSSSVAGDIAQTVSSKYQVFLASDLLKKSKSPEFKEFQAYIDKRGEDDPEGAALQQKELDRYKKKAAAGTFATKQVRKGVARHLHGWMEPELSRFAEFEALWGGKILLVDDIATSGSTMDEMFYQAQRFQPQLVVGFVLIYYK